MPMVSKRRRAAIRRRFKKCPLECEMHLPIEIATLSDYFAVFDVFLDPSMMFWFRGHSMRRFRLAPSALRYGDELLRTRALAQVAEMRRYLEMKLRRPPERDDTLGWMQVAQHYGLPTRLLDWTQNAAAALFFACSGHPEDDGLVIVLNPIELNAQVNPTLSRILDPQRDSQIIKPYFQLGANESRRGIRTIAINPTWNTERIAMQQGVFTLHGARSFELDRHQASSLAYVPILREHKERLLQDLERVGVGEMFLYPEAEHVCSHLKRAANLGDI